MPPLQIRAGQWSTTANLWPLTTHIYHVMIFVTDSCSKKSFFIIIFRSSHMQMFFKTGIIRDFAIFIGKHLCWSLFLIKLQGSLQLYSTSSKKRLEHRWFLWKLQTFYKQLLLWNTSGGCFCHIDNITVQWWASADLLFLIKNKICGMLSTKKVCRSGQSMSFAHY